MHDKDISRVLTIDSYFKRTQNILGKESFYQFFYLEQNVFQHQAFRHLFKKTAKYGQAKNAATQQSAFSCPAKTGGKDEKRKQEMLS